MPNVSNSSPAHENPSRHRCTEAMERLLHTISRVNNINLEPLQDLVVALERALYVAQASRRTIASTECIQIKYDSTMEGHSFPWSTHQLNMEDLSNDCFVLDCDERELILGDASISESAPIETAGRELVPYFTTFYITVQHDAHLY
ncbi:hypothetical protein F5887DRAFT_922811 [Amanita rubescens]|nr:hypothetical protein F5887DRAFT_922811 [Amanita rubescens]